MNRMAYAVSTTPFIVLSILPMLETNLAIAKTVSLRSLKTLVTGSNTFLENPVGYFRKCLPDLKRFYGGCEPEVFDSSTIQKLIND